MTITRSRRTAAAVGAITTIMALPALASPASAGALCFGRKADVVVTGSTNVWVDVDEHTWTVTDRDTDAVLDEGTHDVIEIVVVTGSGDDVIEVDGYFGNNTIDLIACTGAGRDIVQARLGDDSIDTGAGNDVVASDEGDDTLILGDGNDITDSGAGDDLVSLGAGDDQALLSAGDDVVSSGPGLDWIDAGDGRDGCDVGTFSGFSADDTYQSCEQTGANGRFGRSR